MAPDARPPFHEMGTVRHSKNMREIHRLALLRGADARHRPMAVAQLDAIRTLILDGREVRDVR